jgi:hypothetical protein
MPMTFHKGYNSARIRKIANYAQAKEHYESVVPIRGRDNVRPLGANRRYHSLQIVKKMVSIEVPDNPLGEWAEVYSCRLWGSDYVTFYPNGDLVIQVANGYHGVSVMNMLTYSLGMGVVGSMRGKWYFINKKNESFLIGKEPTVFSLVDGDYVAKAPTPEVVYSLNRKEMNALRKKYKKFFDYAHTALAIDSKIISGGDGSKEREMSKILKYFKLKDHDLLPIFYWGRQPDFLCNQTTIAEALDTFIESGDLELAYNLMFLFAHNAGSYSYRDSSISCSPQSFKKYFDDFLKYAFRDKLFVAKEVEVGVPFYDANKKFMREYD